MAQPRGEAADYYQNGEGNNPGPGYQMDDGQKFAQEPPQYTNQYGAQPPQQSNGEKYTFEDAFRIEKPKWNDLWAGILVRQTGKGAFSSGPNFCLRSSS